MKKKAFTVIETIIFITIIGFLLITLIFLQESSKNSDIKAQIAQIASFDSAVKQFHNKYNALPGDIDFTIFYGLSSKNTDGNNNGILNDEKGDITQASSEITHFWQHLSKAQLINRNFDGSEKNQAKIGKTFPVSKISNNRGITVFGYNGTNYYQIGVAGSNKNNITMSDKTLKASEALDMDIKIDNSMPTSGRVIAVTGKKVNGLNQNERCVRNEEYNSNSTEPACQLRIEFGTLMKN